MAEDVSLERKEPVISLDALIDKLTSDLAAATGMTDQEIGKVTLHNFEKRFSIKIEKPKREFSGRLGYHRYRRYVFIPPAERELKIEEFLKNYDLNPQEFRSYLTEE